jgi:hypothetical protein
MDVSPKVGIMAGIQWQDLQDLLLYVFAPLAMWWSAFFVASGVFAGIYFLFLWLFQWLTKAR